MDNGDFFFRNDGQRFGIENHQTDDNESDDLLDNVRFDKQRGNNSGHNSIEEDDKNGFFAGQTAGNKAVCQVVFPGGGEELHQVCGSRQVAPEMNQDNVIDGKAYYQH